MISTQFLQNCQSGDEDAILSLVRTYQRGVFQLALSILDDSPVEAAGLNQADQAEAHTPGQAVAPVYSSQAAVSIAEAAREAETATRETFIAALDRLGHYREDTPFVTWLYSIAIEISRKRARRWKTRRWWWHLIGQRVVGAWRKITNQTDELYAEPAPEAMHFLPGDIEMWSAVRGLNEKLRIPLVLRYYHDFEISEIARLLHISEGAVHARLDSARERIAVNLEK